MSHELPHLGPELPSMEVETETQKQKSDLQALLDLHRNKDGKIIIDESWSSDDFLMLLTEDLSLFLTAFKQTQTCQMWVAKMLKSPNNLQGDELTRIGAVLGKAFETGDSFFEPNFLQGITPAFEADETVWDLTEYALSKIPLEKLVKLTRGGHAGDCHYIRFLNSEKRILLWQELARVDGWGHDADFLDKMLITFTSTPKYLIEYLQATCDKTGWKINAEQLGKSIYAGSGQFFESETGEKDWEYDNHYLANNLEAIRFLEFSKEGSSAYLQKKFGINQFARYPQQLLLGQAIGIERPDRYGLAVYCQDDWNGALKEARQYLYTLPLQLQSQAPGVKLFIAECTSLRELVSRLLDSTPDPGSTQQPLQFLIVAAHGSNNGFTLSKEVHGRVTIEDFDRPGSSRLEGLLAPNASVVFDSCDAGGIGGIADAARTTLSRPSSGAVISFTTSSILINNVTPSGIELKATYDRNEANGKIHLPTPAHVHTSELDQLDK